jgi:DnaJ-class molecular chaperone
VHIVVDVPTGLNDRQKDLLRQFDDTFNGGDSGKAKKRGIFK